MTTTLTAAVGGIYIDNKNYNSNDNDNDNYNDSDNDTDNHIYNYDYSDGDNHNDSTMVAPRSLWFFYKAATRRIEAPAPPFRPGFPPQSLLELRKHERLHDFKLRYVAVFA